MLNQAQADMITAAINDGRLTPDEATVTRDLLNGVIDGTQADARLRALRGGDSDDPAYP